MKTDNLFTQKLIVNYDGKKYAANPFALLSQFEATTPSITAATLPAELEPIADIEEDAETIKLKLGKIYFDLDASGNAQFTPKYTKEIGFDKTTQRGIGDKITEEDIETYGNSNSSLVNMVLVEYLSTICHENANVYEYFRTKHNYLAGALRYKITSMNILNLITFNLLELEKLINSKNDKILEEGLSKKDFELNEASKLHQVLGLPKVAISAVKDLKLEYALNEIKNLSETLDGNSLKIFFEFIENLKILLKADKGYDKEGRIIKFISDFNEVSQKNYRTPDLLNFLLRQNFYYSSAGILTFPYNEMGLLKDYLHMSEIYKIKVEKYPSQLKRQHDILAKNVSSLEKLSPELEEQFRLAVDTYKTVERTIKVAYPCKKGEIPEYEEFTFIVPRTIKDIIQEGNDLHHCVGSYSDRIINKDSRIVFMRLSSNTKESLITVDISEDFKLLEAAGNGNCELNDIQKKALNAWLKEISK